MMQKKTSLTVIFLTLLIPNVYSLQCYQCGWADASLGGEDLNCAQGTGIDDQSADCSSNGWGDECITRVRKEGTGEDEKEFFFRSCMGKGMTCEEGYVTFGDDNELWTSCCSEDHCNTKDPRDVLTTDEPSDTTPPTTDGLHCYECGWAEASQGDDALNCVMGTDIDKSTDCSTFGWGDECISRVLRTGTGTEDEKEWTFRSCIGEHMTCENGHIQYGENNENDIWTSCCSSDNCNTEDPRDVLGSTTPSTETTAEGLHCYHCGWADVSQGEEAINCVEGTNIEDSLNCGAYGWGDTCITRVVRDNTDEDDIKEYFFRSCMGTAMDCDEGYIEYGTSQVWTSCCSDNNCNNVDPRDVLGPETTMPTLPGTTTSNNLHCLNCGWALESEGGAQLECVLGNDIEHTSVDCLANGWAEGCITRVVKDITEDQERLWYLRSCIGNGMKCEEGYVNYEDQGEMWTTCCDDENNCNSDDPRDQFTTPTPSETPSTSLHCYHCGWEDASDESACVLGTNLDDTITDCEASGWGNECITRVLRTTTADVETDWFFRSCIGANMICEEGYVDFGRNKLWTTCCSDDNCNDDDPREVIETTTSTTTTTTTKTTTTTTTTMSTMMSSSSMASSSTSNTASSSTTTESTPAMTTSPPNSAKSINISLFLTISLILTVVVSA